MSIICLIPIFFLFLLRAVGYGINRNKLFHRIFLPASITSGLLGLMIIQGLGRFIPPVCMRGWDMYPMVLINVVFAALFMSFTLPSLSPGSVWRYCGPQLLYGQIVAWGQYIVGLGISWFILSPVFSTPPYLGIIIPLGFEGGHGTTAALHATFENLHWEQGADYSFAAATVGIISALVVGMVLINWAVARGHTKVLKFKEDVISAKNKLSEGDQGETAAQPFSLQAARSVGIHLTLVGLAILTGFFVKQGLGQIVSHIPFGAGKNFFHILPLAPFSILGAILFSYVLKVYMPSFPIQPQRMQHISGTALDYLVISAVAMLNIQSIATDFVPFLILVAAVVIWNVFCVVWLARRLLPDAWFERATVQLGQSMGVTATGLLLLRVVDPRMETKALSAFGYKQLIHEPLMGGGLWPFIVVPLAVVYGPAVVFFISIAAVVIWLLVWWFGFRGRTL
ncbi:MAG: hypothetical protein WC450_01790 [Candidatus Omnitrophota bacterium]|jgi:ESS family glutamate:Na+ symporter